jgi:hypothetical protein
LQYHGKFQDAAFGQLQQEQNQAYREEYQQPSKRDKRKGQH